MHNGSEVMTTYEVDRKFFGIYKGPRKGYLELKEDGTGTYHYDVFAFPLQGCKYDPIPIIWGFLLDEKGKILRYDREYGYSYPILMESTQGPGFKGCREGTLLDFIMVYKDGSFGVSSSDDWVKK